MVASLSLYVCCLSSLAAEPADTKFTTQRAVGVETFLRLVPLDAKGQPKPPYYNLKSDTFGLREPQTLKALGFDSVRLVINPLPLLQITEEERGKIYPLFDKAISKILASGLNVVFNLHLTNQDPNWNPTTVTSPDSNEKFFAYLELVTSVGRFLATYDPHHVAFEFFNEPPCIEPAQWSHYQVQLFFAARRALPEHTLILTGPCFSSLEGLMGIDTTPYDDNTLFSFHFYRPKIFTFQGLPWLPVGYRFIHRLPYPPTDDRSTEFIVSMVKEIVEAPHLQDVEKLKYIKENLVALREYFLTPMDGAWIEREIAKVVRWAHQHSIAPERIFVGEFGANRDFAGYITAAEGDRLRWLEHVRTLLEDAGFAWSVWSDCCEFGIVSGDTGSLDPKVLVALGLGSSERAEGR